MRVMGYPSNQDSLVLDWTLLCRAKNLVAKICSKINLIKPYTFLVGWIDQYFKLCIRLSWEGRESKTLPEKPSVLYGHSSHMSHKLDVTSYKQRYISVL